MERSPIEQPGAPPGGCALVMLVGPPASGKSYLARRLAERLDATLLQTDALRKAMFPRPRYTGKEHFAVYAESHRRIERGLRLGRTVIFDATNLNERKRRVVYRIAERSGARLVVGLTWAPPEVIRRRLAGRQAGLDPLDQSEADWRVYRRLGRPDPISRPHVLVNTTVSLERSVELLARRAGGRAPT